MKRHPPSVVRKQRAVMLDVLRQRVYYLGGHEAVAIERALIELRADPRKLDGALEVLGAMEAVMPSGSDYQWALHYFQDELGVTPDWNESQRWTKKRRGESPE